MQKYAQAIVQLVSFELYHFLFFNTYFLFSIPRRLKRICSWGEAPTAMLNSNEKISK
jgi:hypothetical protein